MDKAVSSKNSEFPILYKDVASDLQGLAVSRLGNREDAEDVVQEAFLRLHNEQEKTVVRNPRGFVFRVGWRLIIDNLRRRKHLSAMLLNVEANSQDKDERTPEAHVRGREELDEISREIDTLPPQARRVFILRRVEGKTFAEIAEELHIKERTAKNYMIRALEGLAEHTIRFREPDDD